jgi:hypothetical protein
MITTRFDVCNRYSRGFYRNKNCAVYVEGAAFQVVILEVVYDVNDSVAGFIQMAGEETKSFFFRRIQYAKGEPYFKLGVNRYRLNEFVKVVA